MGAAREGERRGRKGARASSRGGPEGPWAARRTEETVLIKSSSACWPSGGRKDGSFSIRVAKVPGVCGSEAWRPRAEGKGEAAGRAAAANQLQDAQHGDRAYYWDKWAHSGPI